MSRLRFVCVVVIFAMVGLFRGDAAAERPSVVREAIPSFACTAYRAVFKADEAARVIVIGNGRARLALYAFDEIVIGNGRARLALYAFDENGNCVARDDLPSPEVVDAAALLWFPAKRQSHHVVVSNLGAVPNVAEVVIR